MKYRDLVIRNCAKDLDLEEQLILVALGLTGEAGEVADLIKKVFYHKHPLDKEKLILELGDCLWYIEYASLALGITREEIEQKNIEKCLRRYPNGFNSKDSIKRETI
jgi:NTP pyrophosphatase (non-canonical NTP hydrolase)